MAPPDVKKLATDMPGSPDWAASLAHMLNPLPLASMLWQNRGLLDPVTALQHYGNFAKTMGGSFADYAENMDKLHGIDESEEYKKQLELDQAQQEDPSHRIFNTELEKSQAAADYREMYKRPMPAESTPAPTPAPIAAPQDRPLISPPMPPGIQGNTSPDQLRVLMRMMGVQQ